MKKFLVAFLIVVSTGVAALAQPISNEAKLEYNRGYDFYKIGQYDRSIAAFKRAIEIDPNYVDAYYNLGSILEYLHQDDEALNVFKQVIVRKPDDYESIYKAGDLSIKLGQTEKAKSYLELIPVNSSMYSKAQALIATIPVPVVEKPVQPLYQESFKAEDVKSLVEEKMEDYVPEPVKEMVAPKTLVDQTNGMYNNIPSPTGITTDSQGNVYIASFSDNIIYKVTPDGRQMVYIKNHKLNGPIAMVSDALGNIYVSNYNNNNVLRIGSSGLIEVLISNVDRPYGMSIAGNVLFVSSQGSNSVLRYKL